MGAEGLPYGVVCIVGGPAPSHNIGGADDKLKRKPSLDLSSRPVVFSLDRSLSISFTLSLSLSHAIFLSLAHACGIPFADKLLRCITTYEYVYTRHNDHKLECYRVFILFRIESRNARVLLQYAGQLNARVLYKNSLYWWSSMSIGKIGKKNVFRKNPSGRFMLRKCVRNRSCPLRISHTVITITMYSRLKKKKERYIWNYCFLILTSC